MLAETLTALRSPEELYELLDPDVMWYSAGIDSNCTCNDKDDVVACIERNLAAGMTGRFEVLAEGDDVAVARPVFDPPLQGDGCLLLRFRDDAIVEMRDFTSAQAALGYAGLVRSGGPT
jgi:hypothetical protein